MKYVVFADEYRVSNRPKASLKVCEVSPDAADVFADPDRTATAPLSVDVIATSASTGKSA